MSDTPPKTHNADAAARTIADRISRMLDEADAIKEDIKDTLAEAKSVGFDPAAVRAAVAVKRMSSEKREKYLQKQEAIDGLLAKFGVI